MKPKKQSSLGYLEPGKLLPRFLLLTAIKEIYLFLANSYGLLFHPLLTVKKVMVDRSQLGLFLIIWITVWLGLIGVGLVYFFINNISFFGGRLYWFGVVTILGMTSLLLAFSGYVLYLGRKKFA